MSELPPDEQYRSPNTYELLLLAAMGHVPVDAEINDVWVADDPELSLDAEDIAA